MSSAERPRRKTWHGLKRQGPRHRIATQSLDRFPLGCPTVLKRASCSRLCCTVFGGAYVGSVSSSRAGVARRGHLSRRWRAAPSLLDPLMYPHRKGRRTRYGCYTSARCQSSPPRARGCIYVILPRRASVLGCLSSPIGTSLSLCCPCTSCATSTARSQSCHHMHSRKLPCTAPTDPPRARAEPMLGTGTRTMRSLSHLSA